MTIVDTHCHLYLPEFDIDRSAMLERAILNGVERFYLPAIDSAVINAMLAMESAWPNHCFPMMGLHPCSVKANHKSELSVVEDWLSKRSFIAIGEIGLDFYWDKTFVAEQYAAFKQQMEWALQYNMPIVIHSRDSIQESIDAVKPYAARGLRGIFHCFGSSLQAANEIIAMGFYLGIGGVITYKKSGLAEVIKDVPLEHLVLETDAPYLTPVPFRGKRNESSYITYVAEAIAAIKSISVEEVAEQTTKNANMVFNTAG